MSGTVRMIPGGAHRPHGAMAWLSEIIVEGREPRVRGVIVIAIDEDGNCDTRIFGDARRYELAWAGAVLSNHSVNGDFE